MPMHLVLYNRLGGGGGMKWGSSNSTRPSLAHQLNFALA